MCSQNVVFKHNRQYLDPTGGYRSLPKIASPLTGGYRERAVTIIDVGSVFGFFEVLGVFRALVVLKG